VTDIQLPDAALALALAPPQDGASILPRAALDAPARAELLALLQAHFDGVDAAQFARDLDGKDWVLRIRRGGRLVGFSTLAHVATTLDGAPAHVVYSGDTIVAPEAWGSPALARAWIALVRALQGAVPPAPWYWLLLSSGFRTYRFLPVFWRDFWPRHDVPTPADARARLDALAAARYGDAYDARTGIVRFGAPQRLRDRLATVPDGRELDAHVRFFLGANPGHAAGDELACLTRLDDANLTAAGRRMVGLPRA
jgi:hypothetical protein